MCLEAGTGPNSPDSAEAAGRAPYSWATLGACCTQTEMGPVTLGRLGPRGREYHAIRDTGNCFGHHDDLGKGPRREVQVTLDNQASRASRTLRFREHKIAPLLEPILKTNGSSPKMAS